MNDTRQREKEKTLGYTRRDNETMSERVYEIKRLERKRKEMRESR